MIHCKFDFINDTLPPRHNKNAEEYAKQQMHKSTIANGTQQRNSTSITTMRNNQIIENSETHFHTHVAPLARNHKETPTRKCAINNARQCENKSFQLSPQTKTMTEILIVSPLPQTNV